MSRTKNPPKSQKNEQSDYLWDAALENCDSIQRAYKMFEDKKPVMLLDIQEQLLYAYPYEEFRDDMSERSQAILTEQYEQAQRKDQIVVFVRDNKRRKLVSYSVGRE